MKCAIFHDRVGISGSTELFQCPSHLVPRCTPRCSCALFIFMCVFRQAGTLPRVHGLLVTLFSTIDCRSTADCFFEYHLGTSSLWRSLAAPFSPPSWPVLYRFALLGCVDHSIWSPLERVWASPLAPQVSVGGVQAYLMHFAPSHNASGDGERYRPRWSRSDTRCSFARFYASRL